MHPLQGGFQNFLIHILRQGLSQLSLCVFIKDGDAVPCDIDLKNTEKSCGDGFLKAQLVLIAVFQLLLFTDIL